MAGRFLLDTNIVIALFAGDVPVMERLATADEVYVPVIALGELQYGARASGKVDANLVRLDEFASHSAILGCDEQTARHYGEIRSELKARGRPLPENDIWIAAIARQHDLIVVTRDIHFKDVERLKTESWS